MSLPYQPLLTIERSSLPEVTIYGILSVLDGEMKPLISLGDQNTKIWTRSCLKPWQLLNHLHILKKHYPALADYHYALMLSSHSAQDYHLQALDEMEAIAGLDDSVLQNTPLYPINPAQRFAFRQRKLAPCSRWGSCSGKHLGFIMALKAAGLDASNYLDPASKHFLRMKKLLAYLIDSNWQDIPETTDGCRLPNYAMTAPQLARLYNQLGRSLHSLHLPEPEEELKEELACFDLLKTFMHTFPQYVGGDERFDTQLMQGKYSETRETTIYAKEGADGLLSIGVAPCKLYPEGLGIVIKSSSGDDPRYFKLIALELLARLNLLRPGQRPENKLSHLNFVYHFNAIEPVYR